MKINNKNGIIQIVLSYVIIWSNIILINCFGIINKDYFLLSIFVSALIMCDAKMKHENLIVNINFFIIIAINLVVLILHII